MGVLHRQELKSSSRVNSKEVIYSGLYLELLNSDDKQYIVCNNSITRDKEFLKYLKRKDKDLYNELVIIIKQCY